MASDNVEVGELNELHTEAFVLWKVPDYFSLSQKADHFFESPFFPFSGSLWCLRIYPNGERRSNSVESVGLYLRRKNSSNEEFHINVEFSIMSGNDLMSKQVCHWWVNRDFHGMGIVKYIERAQLLRNKHRFVPGGILTVKCVAKLFSDVTEASCQTVSVDGVSTLCRDFHSLLRSEHQSDVTIKVKHKIFRVHKLILETRSPVFAAMFKHDMKEKNSGVVNIEDCDPNTFQNFLLFVYTGQVENFSTDNVIGLYLLANKYDLSSLKERCVDFIKENMCLDMVCDVVSIGHNFNEAELEKLATELLLKNIKTVMSTEKWLIFVSENPLLATKLLMAVIPENENLKNK